MIKHYLLHGAINTRFVAGASFGGGMSDRLTIQKPAFTTWQIRPNLRWSVPAGATTKEPVLQQAWTCLEDGRVEWRDVETVVQNKVSE
jgi:hypothetical protein